MVATKKTVKKTTAKKTTVKKTTAAKTTAAKTAAAKTTAAKKTTAKKTTAPKKTTTAKKTTVKKTTTTATGLSVSGNKKILTLQKEFNKQFPYLRITIHYSYVRAQVKKGETIYQIPGDKTLASVRRGDTTGTISISGNKKIKSLEKEFDTVFGLYAQVSYTDRTGNRYYTTGSSDEKTLSAFNEECKNDGCKKGVYR